MYRFFLIVLSFLSILISSTASAATTSIDDSSLNVRNTSIGSTGIENASLSEFAKSDSIQSFFMTPTLSGGDTVVNIFIMIAFGIKNFFIGIAIIFLIIWVLKLLFSGAGDEDVKKWKSNIIWVSIGIFVMQIAFSAWNTFLILDPGTTLGSELWWKIWTNIFSPMVSILQTFAAAAFLLMAVYAFYTIVTGGGDEEKLKKWKNMVIYGLIGFLLIRIPKMLVQTIYGNASCTDGTTWTMQGSCGDLEKPENLNSVLNIFWTFLQYFNSFLMFICVLLVIYAGWLVLISAGDEEKLKKAKNIVLYILIGFIILLTSHAIFRFFIMQ